MSKCVLLDTSFFIRLLNKEDELHETALGYFNYLLENGFTLKMSTIALAEFCAKGKKENLPLRNLMLLSFNPIHAERAGELIGIIFEEKLRRGAQIAQRAIIPNDTKMFAQADTEENITHFISADSEAKKVFDLLQKGREATLSFQYVDIREQTYKQTFSTLF